MRSERVLTGILLGLATGIVGASLFWASFRPDPTPEAAIEAVLSKGCLPHLAAAIVPGGERELQLAQTAVQDNLEGAEDRGAEKTAGRAWLVNNVVYAYSYAETCPLG